MGLGLIPRNIMFRTRISRPRLGIFSELRGPNSWGECWNIFDDWGLGLRVQIKAEPLQTAPVDPDTYMFIACGVITTKL